jgi:hypothetical protein
MNCWIGTWLTRGPSLSLRASGRPLMPPPWLSFSGSCPCVTLPSVSILSPANGSLPPTGFRVTAMGMMPIDSYHDPRLVSYVALIDTTSPLLTFTRQLGSVAVIETSHDTGPAGS